MTNIWEPAFKETDVEIETSDSVFSGHFEANRLKLRHRKFSGDWSAWLHREQVKPFNSAAVILYDPKRDQVVMIEQFRVGALNEKNRAPWLLEVVAGYIEAHEAPPEAIKREALEEAACEIKALYPILNYYPSPGGVTEKTNVYCGLCDASKAGGIHGSPLEDEDIKVHVLSALDVFKLLEEGMMTSSATVIALQWLKMNRDHLRSVGYL